MKHLAYYTAVVQQVLFIFIDGLGVGEKNSAINPLAAFEPQVLRVFQGQMGPFPRRGTGLVTDACLGVAGLPQSATGQTSLLTGLNAARRLGRHLQGFPNQVLKALIERESLFQRLQRRGLSVTFANTYTPGFFEKRPRRVSVSTVMCETAKVPLWRLEDLRDGRSLFMDFTNRALQERGFEIPLRTPAQAAQVLLDLAARYHLCFYEYFLTDLVGHRGTFEEAVDLLRQLDLFLAAVVEQVDLERLSVVVCSDHGNIEQMDSPQHTTHSVPTLLWGGIQKVIPTHCSKFSLVDVAPLIEDFVSRGSCPRSPAVT